MLHLKQEDGQTGPPAAAVDTTQEVKSTEEDPNELSLPYLDALRHVDTDSLLLMMDPTESEICRYSCCYYWCWKSEFKNNNSDNNTISTSHYKRF